MVDESKVLSRGVGIVNILPSLFIDNVLYVSGSSFNLLFISRLTRFLDCVISFPKYSICLQYRSSGQMIGTECESHSVYHLWPSTHVITIMESPSLFHAKLGHPCLAKLQ